ncbi:MAG: Isomerizing Glutamine-fructose-6-phosphate aminotransferase [candidate division WS6 bacterium GW2011_GWE1_34_7]|uniref:Glutamine--fructose-6-phosphate aminotransferase [isomerizing] n=1 Tax=candidate division WS6 bacterium GW2011_GWE1_34_7 TaxID=1619093 RepID=A0A0G0DT35_9BACT|nr:MAG: Isomerizing Glutamine-fructose-6-phosphate aminotransferase [candidate division WS6 bacterium GW2011_GWE1_34_7]
MCGIFGYMGDNDASQIIHQGLKRLEYRGYDSWGISMIDGKRIKCIKSIGHIPEKIFLGKKDSNIGIGHTRWATHGGVTVTNAHPHFSSDKSFVIAQNGIVENYTKLKSFLESKGFVFGTEVDTEVIVKQVEYELRDCKNIKEALIKAFKKLEGRNTVILLNSKENQILAIRNGSPLVMGIKKKKIYLASDPLAFNQYTRNIVDINNGELVEIKDEKWSIYTLSNGKKIERKVKKEMFLNSDVNKGKYDHFMIKEIVEQQHTILTATQYKLEDLKPLIERIKKSSTVYTIGAGTAGFSADQVAYYLRSISKINAISIKAYETESYLDILTEKDTIIAISQSGETADTLEAVEIFKQKGAYISSIINMPSSTLSRVSDSFFMSNAGSEICVASTKVFTSQISFGYLLAKSILGEFTDAKKELVYTSTQLEEFFNKRNLKYIENISKALKKKNHFFILGKGQNFHIAQEGALKIKEISYKHFEGFAAGELKHGVIALIEKGTPVISIISNDQNWKDMISATHEVKARGAFTIGIGDCKFKKENCFDEYISVADSNELKAVSNVIPFQLISYYLAKELGNSIDKPRNLAKSVTVK